MELLCLPPEILQAILIESVRLRGVKRGVRLRLVNKFFAQEVIWAISKSGILENHCNHSYQGSPPGDYLLPRALEEREDNEGPFALQLVRRIANKLCSLNNISDKETWKIYILQLCSLLADARPCFSKVFPAYSPSIIGEGMPSALDTHLLAAASHLNIVSVVKQLIRRGVWQDNPTFPLTSSSLFGHPATLAAKAGCSEVLSLLTAGSCAPTDKARWSHRRGLLSTASAAGHVEAVRVLLRRKWNPSCDKKELRKYLVRALRTPSLEVYEMIKTAINDLDEIPACQRQTKTLGSKLFFKVLFNTCVWEGWVTMAGYFLDIGASVDSCRDNGIKAPFINSSPLAYACRTGNMPMVRLLLSRGLDAKYAMSYAAAGGNLELVKLLLDHGCDPNEGYPPPIAWAVDLEHEAMFKYLHEHGAKMVLPSAKQDIVARAKCAGLESMLSLLSRKGGLDTDGPAYTTPLPRPRKLCFMCEPHEPLGSDNDEE